MKQDIDFEELDKAVTSLMGGVKGDPEPDPEPVIELDKIHPKDESRMTIESDDEPVKVSVGSKPKKERAKVVVAPEPVVDRTDESEVASTKPEDKAKPEVAEVVAPPKSHTVHVRRPAPRPQSSHHGRFMDIVNPKQDMSTHHDAGRRPVAVATPVVRETVPHLVTPHAAEEAPVLSHFGSDKPVVRAAALDKSPEPEEEAEVVDPITSPFLPDAKPVKRPLGGVALAHHAFQEPVGSSYSGVGRNLTPLSEKQVTDLDEFDEPVDEGAQRSDLPEELQDDVLAIETDIALDDSPDIDDTPPPPRKIKKRRDEEIEHNGAALDGAVEVARKYREAAAKGDEETSGAIYDVLDYHKPLSTGKKKTPAWQWVIIVLLVLIIIGTFAATAYMLFMS